MVSREGVQRFLESFNAKMEVYGIIYRDGGGKKESTDI